MVKDNKCPNLRDEIPEQACVPHLGSHFVGDMTVYLRKTSDPRRVMTRVRAKVLELDPTLLIYDTRTTAVPINISLTTERMIASLSTVFGFLATLLATIGLYSVMACTVAQRRRGIGVRMALGTEPRKVTWMVMRDVLWLVALGVGAGVPVSLALVWPLENHLYALTAHAP